MSFINVMKLISNMPENYFGHFCDQINETIIDVFNSRLVIHSYDYQQYFLIAYYAAYVWFGPAQHC